MKKILKKVEFKYKGLDLLDFSAYPKEWAYTYELASGRLGDGEKGKQIEESFTFKTRLQFYR